MEKLIQLKVREEILIVMIDSCSVLQKRKSKKHKIQKTYVAKVKISW